MRRFDKKKHIKELNQKMSNNTITRVIETFPETLKDEDELEENVHKGINLLSEETTTMFDKLCGLKLVAETVEPLNELSSDMVMGAAKKLWQDQIGGDGHYENSRAKKLLNDYADKLIGTKLFGSTVSFTGVDLISGNADMSGTIASFHLLFFISAKREGNNSEIGGGIFYNYSLDQFSEQGSPNDRHQPYKKEISKFDARQLSKIASHFNPNTRYKNFTRELNIRVDEVNNLDEYDEDRIDYDYDNRDGYHNPFKDEPKNVNSIDEAPIGEEEDTYFETLSATLDYARLKAERMGYTLDEDAIHFKFGTGGISYGTTKSATIDLLKDGQPIVGKSGKPLNRALRVVIYRMDSGRYELTCYKTW